MHGNPATERSYSVLRTDTSQLLAPQQLLRNRAVLGLAPDFSWRRASSRRPAALHPVGLTCASKVAPVLETVDG
jgi:hypothetical protein